MKNMVAFMLLVLGGWALYTAMTVEQHLAGTPKMQTATFYITAVRPDANP